jgi:hypothetical protein
MRLTIEASLRRIGDLLREDVAPEVQTPFIGQSVRMASGLLTICANWVDDAAAIRVEENAAIRRLLGEAAAGLEGELAARLNAASQSADPGLRISQLDAENHRLRLLLIEAHEAVEQAGLRDLNAALWRLLEEIDLSRAQREKANPYGQ